jgi:hypothetical protein
MATMRLCGVRSAIAVIAIAAVSGSAYASSIRPSFTEPLESARLSSASFVTSANNPFRLADYESAATSLSAGSGRSSFVSNSRSLQNLNSGLHNAVTEVVSVNHRHHHQVTSVAAAVVTQATGVPDSGNTLLLLFGSVAGLIALRRFAATNCPPA